MDGRGRNGAHVCLRTTSCVQVQYAQDVEVNLYKPRRTWEEVNGNLYAQDNLNVRKEIPIPN